MIFNNTQKLYSMNLINNFLKINLKMNLKIIFIDFIIIFIFFGTFTIISILYSSISFLILNEKFELDF